MSPTYQVAVIEATISLGGLNIATFNAKFKDIFVQKMKEAITAWLATKLANMNNVPEVVVKVLAVTKLAKLSTTAGSERRRRLSKDGDGVKVKFSVSAPGVNAGDLGAACDAYVADQSDSGLSAQLPKSDSGDPYEAEIVESAAAIAANKAQDVHAESGPDLVLFVGIGGAIVVALGLLIVVGVVVAIVWKRKKTAQRLSMKDAVMTGAMLEEGAAIGYERNPMQKHKKEERGGHQGIELADMFNDVNPMVAPIVPLGEDEDAMYDEDVDVRPAVILGNPMYYGGRKDVDNAEETRMGEDGFPYRKAAFVAHYGGTNEWDVAGTLTAAAPLQDENWFYTDHDDVQHGPFTLVKLKGWLEGGHFETSKLVCNGREGQFVELGSVVQVEDTPEETRIGEDGFPYKKAAFIAHYGGTDEWDAAGRVTARV